MVVGALTMTHLLKILKSWLRERELKRQGVPTIAEFYAGQGR